MSSKILAISGRGQITIPKNFRELIPTKYILCRIKNGKVILEPLQTREEFFAELETEEKNWEKKGGYSFEQVMKESNSKS